MFTLNYLYLKEEESKHEDIRICKDFIDNSELIQTEI